MIALCRLVSLHVGDWPRFRVNRWVDDDRATCFDHQYPSEYPRANVFSFRLVLAPVCRDVRLDGLSVSFVSVQAEAVKITELI